MMDVIASNLHPDVRVHHTWPKMNICFRQNEHWERRIKHTWVTEYWMGVGVSIINRPYVKPVTVKRVWNRSILGEKETFFKYWCYVLLIFINNYFIGHKIHFCPINYLMWKCQHTVWFATLYHYWLCLVVYLVYIMFSYIVFFSISVMAHCSLGSFHCCYSHVNDVNTFQILMVTFFSPLLLSISLQ